MDSSLTAGVDDRLVTLPPEVIHPRPGQPRQFFDEAQLRALAESIDSYGQVMRLIIRDHPRIPGHYEIMAGERRWRAIKTYCKVVTTIRAIVITSTDDDDSFRVSFLENEQRGELFPLERAEAMEKLIQLGHTQSDIARMIGRSQSYVQFYLSLLTLHPAVKKLLDPELPEKKRLSFSAAIAIARTPQEVQVELAEFALARSTRIADVNERVDEVLEDMGKERTVRAKRGHSTLKSSLLRLDRLLGKRFSTVESVFSSYHRHGHISVPEIDATIASVEELRRKLELLSARLGMVRERRSGG